MEAYLDLMRNILDNGVQKADRTGTGTLSLFGPQMRFDLSKGFPLLTTKKVYLRGIIHELLWFLSGSTNIAPLVKNKVRIWNEWPFQAYLKANNLEESYPMHSEVWKEKMQEFVEHIKNDDEFAKQWGDLGPVYGKQWIRWDAHGKEINQIQNVIDMISHNPDSRRLMVSGWNVGDIQSLIKGKTSAPPLCHTMFQFYVVNNKLSCKLYQRSADFFLGVPFNIASYSLLTMMIAQVTGKELGDFVHTFGDVHLYSNHLEQTRLQLSRETRSLPTMNLNPEVKNIFDFTFDDFTLENYDPHPPIKAPIAV